jgi:two-component system chemotaxis response regulator CheY
VLIVEDSPAMRQLLALALKHVPELAIDEAGDGVEALRKIKEHGYELVLLDLNMPVMDGMKVLARIRDEGILARTTVAIITTDESAETEERARAMGAKHFLRKPVNRRTVEKLLAEVFGGSDPQG